MALRFSVDEKHLKTELLENNDDNNKINLNLQAAIGLLHSTLATEAES